MQASVSVDLANGLKNDAAYMSLTTESFPMKTGRNIIISPNRNA